MPTTHHRGEPIARRSPSIIDHRLAVIAEYFPEAMTEGRVDWDKLRAALGDLVDDAPERYTFSWAGKRDAIRLLQTPTSATLLPCPGESLDWGETRNLFIEGDNLEALKLLYKPYFGRVKMIYIDPPYNTGNDFIYPDNYADPLDTYLRLTGQRDSEGNLLTTNPETSGRYHSAWLSMMYPRLFLARQLLREDGVIFVSIDDHEVHNLRLLMNEVFGEENLLASLCWERADSPRMDADYFSTKHDYILCYSRNSEAFEILRIPYQGDDIPEHYDKIDESGREYYLKPLRAMGGQGETRAARPNLHYGITAPDGSTVYPRLEGGGDGAWRWSQARLRREAVRIEWVKKGKDWTPYYRIYADDSTGRPPETMLFSRDVGSTRTATAEVKSLFDGVKVFDTPKPVALIRHLMRISTSPGDLVLDFFAGSCAAAHAVLAQNREDGGNRRFIMVQLPEPLPEPVPVERTVRLRYLLPLRPSVHSWKDPEIDAARFAAYERIVAEFEPWVTKTETVSLNTIADIGIERIRRVVARMRQEDEGKLDLSTRETPEDLGFRVFKLAPTHYRSWEGVEGETVEEYARQMALFTDPLRPGWTVVGLIWEAALREGYGLDARIERLEAVATNTVYRVTDSDREQSFTICLDDRLHPDTTAALALGRDDVFVCRDAALDDALAANLALQCRLKPI